MRRLWITVAATLAIGLSACGYNTIQRNDEQVKASWSEVINQYQRRADLVPNLVNTVKGYAAQEQAVLLGVTEARAKVGTIQATPELVNDPEAFKKFQAAQGELSQALKSLIAVTENYPQLKSDANFRDLQAQLEGTENRIAVARNRYIAAVQEYNVTVRSFPTNLTAKYYHYPEKANFTVENEQQIAKPPTVDFGPRLPNPLRLQAPPSEQGARGARVATGGGPGLRLRAGAQIAVPALTGHVVDQTGVLSTEQCSTLEQTLQAFEARKGSQLAVLIVPTTAPETIEQYGIRVAEQWKLGRKKIDDGAILLVARDDHTLRIEVGYGLEGALTDATSKRIISEIIVPHLRQGDFYGGISAGIDR